MIRWVIGFFVIICWMPIQAKDIGVIGDCFQIEETDFLTWITARLHTLQNTGKLDALNRDFKARVKAHILNPTPVPGITTTQTPQMYYYDPTIVLDTPIRDQNGCVLVPKGTRMNPLATTHLHEMLIFLNGSDLNQIRWFKRFIEKTPNATVKLVLTRGNIKTTQRHLHQKVYFDQHGVLCKKLHIHHVPAVVKQVGSRLSIQEVAV